MSVTIPIPIPPGADGVRVYRNGELIGEAMIEPLGQGIDRFGAIVEEFAVATGKLRRVICTIRRRYPHVVRLAPRSRVYRNWNGTVRRKNR